MRFEEEEEEEIDLVLDELVAEGRLDPQKAEYAQEKFQEIHLETRRSLETQERLQELESRLETQLKESSPDLPGEEQIETLERNLKKAQTEAISAIKTEETLKEEIEELEEMKIEVEVQVKKHTELHQQELSAMINAIKQETEDLVESASYSTAVAAKADQELTDSTAGLSKCQEQVKNLEREKEVEERELTKLRSGPERQRNQNDALLNVLSGVKTQNAEMGKKLQDKETSLNALLAKQREKELEVAQTQSTAEQGRVAVDAKRRDLEDIQHDMDLILGDYQQHLADRVQIDLLVKEKNSGHNSTQETRRQTVKEKEESIRLAQEAEEQLSKAKSELPPLDITKQKLLKEKHELELKAQRAKEETDSLKKDQEILMSDILNDEQQSEAVKEIVREVAEQNRSLDEEIETHKSIERANNKIYSSLLHHRDQLLRVVSSTVQKQKDFERQLMLKDKTIASLQSSVEEKQKRQIEFQELCELMKKQRNQFTHLIKVSHQGVKEVESKKKLLSSEADCKRSQLDEKNAKLVSALAEQEVTKSERDAARNEVENLKAKLLSTLGAVEAKTAQIEKTLAIINQREKDMVKAKEQFEALLQNRNYTGLLLIDRNDELCLLYEKSNLYEHIASEGELALRRREDEIRILKIKARDAERSISASRKSMEKIPDTDKEISWLKCQLLEARRQTQDLSTQLDDPDNDERWRKLPGCDPEAEKLEERLEELQLNINSKAEQLVERTLFFEELSQTTTRMQADYENSTVNNDAYLKEELLRQEKRLQSIRQKVKAKKAEILIIKDLLSESATELRKLNELIIEANSRFLQGLSPTEECEKQWLQHTRYENTVNRLTEEKTKLARLLSLNPKNYHDLHNYRYHDSHGIESTYEPRPNAYIPDDLGIPRPFGYGSVFKPTPSGATMRYYRKPKLPDIII